MISLEESDCSKTRFSYEGGRSGVAGMGGLAGDETRDWTYRLTSSGSIESLLDRLIKLVNVNT